MPKPLVDGEDDGENLRELDGGRKTAQELAEEVLEVEEGEGEEVALEADDDDNKDERIGKGREGEAVAAKPGERRDARVNETEEQRRERRRKEKKEAKVRRQEAITRDKAELRFLRDEIDRLHRSQAETRKAVVGNQVVSIDSRIEAIESRIRQADEVIARAVEAQNGDDMVKAQGIRDRLVRSLDRLQVAKQNTIQVHQREQQESAAEGERSSQRQPNPVLVAEFRRFHQRNDWFDPKGSDEDSAVVIAIDNVLTAEGKLDPTTPEYWAELERRAKKRIPHKFEGVTDVDDEDDDDDDEDEPERGRQNGQQRPNGGAKPAARKNGGPRMPSAGNNGASGNAGTFYVSADRKQAMIDAGVWDDPKLRQRYIKKYREWDAANAPRDRR